MPRLSAVVPFYNVERYLGDCLESISVQPVDDLEVIMVDDGSTDAGPEIAERFAARDERFKLIRQPNGGLGNARNTGIDASTGDFLAFVDGDDELPPRAYGLLLRTLERTGSDFASGNVTRVSAQGSEPSYFISRACSATRLKTHVTRFRALLADRTAWNKLFRRSFWDEHALRFPEGVTYEDAPVMLPAHFMADSVDVLADVVYHYRVRDDGPPSIMQRRFERPVVLDRFAALRHVLDYLTREGPQGARRWYEESLLGDDLLLYIDKLDRVDEETRDFFLDRLDEFLADVSPQAFESLSPFDRLKWYLARNRLIPELFEILRYQREELVGARPVRVGWRWYADYPFRLDPQLNIPPTVYAYRPRYVLQRAFNGDRSKALRAIVRSVRP